MAIRVPPGRAGRLWLLRRIEVARRGADVLEQKRRTILRERLLLGEQLVEATAAWERAAAAASDWNARAAAAAGPRALRLAAVGVAGTAVVTVTERNVLGTTVPDSATVSSTAAPGRGVTGGAVIRLAAEAHGEALVAAAVLAARRAAHEAIEAELHTTVRRLRAIEHRWIPRHEGELARLQLSLDEAELADIARARWAAERQS
jgi:V/A-type H+-transporting ATPase subunit D